MSDIIGAFRINKVKVIGNNVQYTILFMKDRLVFLVTGGQFADILQSQAKQEQLQRLGQMSSDEIKQLDKRNFQLSYGDIIGIEIKESIIGLNSARTGSLSIITNKKDKYDIAPGQNFEVCRDIVREALPNKLVGNTVINIQPLDQLQGKDSRSSTLRTADVGGLDGRSRLNNRLKTGASWFFWISGLSIINVILIMTGSNINFLIGLGVTQVTAFIMKAGSSQYAIVALILTLVVVAAFVGLGLAARRGKSWAFITGITLYTLDAVLLLAFQDWLSAAFHAFALYFVILGAIANLKIKKLNQTF
jgi:hypothetical protein